MESEHYVPSGEPECFLEFMYRCQDVIDGAAKCYDEQIALGLSNDRANSACEHAYALEVQCAAQAFCQPLLSVLKGQTDGPEAAEKIRLCVREELGKCVASEHTKSA